MKTTKNIHLKAIKHSYIKSIIIIVIFFLCVDSILAQGPWIGTWGPGGHSRGECCNFNRGWCHSKISINPYPFADSGRADVRINNSKVQIVYRDYPYPINGSMPVDSNESLTTELANALGYQSIVLVQGNYPLDLSTYQYGETTIDAILISSPTVTLSCPFGRHGNVCLFNRGFCIRNLEVGESPFLDYGRVNAAVLNNSKVRFVFLKDPQPINGSLPVDSNVVLSTDVSIALGYQSITLLQGDYPVNYSNSQYGEIIVNAILSDPLPTLNVKVISEGFVYVGSNSCSNVNFSNISDKYSVSLRSGALPYNVIDTAIVKIDSVTFSGICYFKNALPGNYYISINHRNSLETWSTNPVAVSTMPKTYDFTSTSSKAFGNNMVLKSGDWCIYSGDVNQDERIDLSDVLQISNDANSFVTGVTDLNADGTTDLSDLVITSNNATNFVATIRP
jgi:hypothetical protein